MKDVTTEAFSTPTRRAQKSRYLASTAQCLDLPMGQCTAVKKRKDGSHEVTVVNIQEASNEQISQCLKLFGWSMIKAGDTVAQVISNTKVQEVLDEFLQRNGRVIVQNPEFVTDSERSPSCLWFFGKTYESMLSPEEMQVRRQSKLVELQKKFRPNG